MDPPTAFASNVAQQVHHASAANLVADADALRVKAVCVFFVNFAGCLVVAKMVEGVVIEKKAVFREGLWLVTKAHV
jgi:hypothetical protein